MTDPFAPSDEDTEQGQAAAPPRTATPRPWPGDLERLADRYVLEEPIARGGVAVVWRAWDERLGRSVAVKVLLPHVATDEVTVERFRREMVSAAAVSHPNVVSVYDTGQVGDLVYLVMEHVDGPSLKEVLRELGPLDPLVAAALGEQVAAALAQAHDLGLVHRDIKPANILLTSDGVVKVTDFGIATAVDDDSPTLTAEGKVVGTAAYLAPEQLQGRTADPRVDVYSLGIVLYECLVGRPPFQGDTPTATATARLTTDVVPPRQLRADVPRDLDAVVVRATARNADDRYADVDAMAAALTRLVPATPEDLTARLVDGQERPHAVVTEEMPRTRAPVDGAGRHLRRLVGAFGVGLLAATTALVVARSLSDEPDAAAPPDGVVEVRNAADFDPFGDPPSEHPEDVPLAHDADPRTAWTTEQYRGSATFGGLKVGVGLWFDVGADASIDVLELDLGQAGGAFEVYAVEELPDAVDGLVGWDRPRFTVAEAEATSVLDVSEIGDRRFWLIWFTSLPRNENGLFQARVDEVRFLDRG